MVIESVVHEIGVFGLKTAVAKSFGEAMEYVYLKLLRGGFDRNHACSDAPEDS